MITSFPELDDGFVLRGLSRTILLLRDHLIEGVTDGEIANALLSTRVAIVSDSAAIGTAAAQSAITTIALLCARSGAAVTCLTPSAPIIGPQPPLKGAEFSEALSECLQDLIRSDAPPILNDAPFDLLAVVGTPDQLPPARSTLWIAADDWSGSFSSTEPIACNWPRVTSPFGSLATAGLVASEAFKSATRRLERFASNPEFFRDFFARSLGGTVSLAQGRTPPLTPALGDVDVISGGAISQTVLYALARIPGVNGSLRVVEPDASEDTNLNRYALLRRSKLYASKALALAALAADGSLSGLTIQPETWRYDEHTAGRLEPLAPRVVVGVDHIPTRWLVQKRWPAWLGIGATSHYDAMVSIHRAGEAGCAGCAHPVDDPADGPLPTAAVVTHWAGVLLAAQLARDASGARASSTEQLTYCFPLRLTTRNGIWRSAVAPNPRCSLHCSESLTHRVGRT